MKKVLYSTTALAAAGLLAFSPADAQAAEKIKLGLGGFYIWQAGVANNDNDKYDDVNGAINMVGDSEVYFTGNTTLDNGLRVDVIIQLETDQTNNGIIDESYIKVGNTKQWGEFRLGSTKQAHFIAGRTGAPAVNDIINATNPDPLTFYLNSPTGTGVFSHEGGADRMLAAYYTPNVNGFQAGVSYTPAHANSNGPAKTEGDMASDVENLSLGAKYSGKFGDAGVTIAAGHTTVDGGKAGSPRTYRVNLLDGDGNPLDTPTLSAVAPVAGSEIKYTTTQAGGIVSFAGFSVGGQWAKRENDNAAMKAKDIEGFVVGTAYKTGPWKVALTWMNTTQDPSPAAGENESNVYTLGAAYSLGAGVTAGVSVITADYEHESGDPAKENAGSAFVGGIKVAF